MSRILLFALLLAAPVLAASSPVYVVLWFDTEDYIEPSADDAALRIANDLTSAGVKATFKVVGEKARTLERRGRRDVIAALAKHSIGYHSDWHSVHPTPAEYLVHFGYLEGAREFERRQGRGFADVKRIFGTEPACYGQPGSSWGPQANLALRRLGVRVYLDEGDQVGVNEQPFWYDGLLYVFHMGRNQFRARLDAGSEDTAAYKQFDEAAARLASSGGGVISIYYHPTEFVTTEFWDGVNFAHGANPAQARWVRPHRRTRADSERCYGVLRKFVEHMKRRPGVQFATAGDLPGLYRKAVPTGVDRKKAAAALSEGIAFREIDGQILSPADLLLALLRVEPGIVDGPTAPGATTYAKPSISADAFARVAADAADFVRREQRLPDEVFVGGATLSLADFAATLAASILEPANQIRIVPGKIAFDRYFATDPRKPFNWVIHMDGFSGGPLLDLGRLQGWTLKPAKLAQ